MSGNVLKYLTLILIPGLFSACSSIFADSKQADESVGPVTVDIHLSRTSLTQTEYEQYKFMNDRLYFECGAIKGGRPSMKQQDIIDITEDDRDAVSKATAVLYSRVVNAPALSWEAPGKNSDLFDPGKALISLKVGEKKVDIRTSVSALDGPSERAVIEAAEVIKAVRKSVGTPPCGNRKFYGIG